MEEVNNNEEANNKEERPSYSRPPWVSQSHPWLVFVHGKHRQRQTFFSISEGRYHIKVIPEMRNKSICCSSHKWLVLKDLDSHDCFFLNPISLEKIQLPSLPFNVRSGILLLPPTNINCCLSFICKGDYFVFWMHGDPNFHVWEIELEDENDWLDSAVFFKGDIYGLASPSFKLVVQDEIEASRVRFRQFIDSGSLPFEPSSLQLHKIYMVTSWDDLFLICKIYSDSFADRSVVLGFEIFRVDFSKKAWEKVKSIGKYTIFLSTYDESSFITGPSPSPGIKSNSIYFTEGRYLHVYDLEDRSISISLPCPQVPKHWKRSYQYWINI